MNTLPEALERNRRLRRLRERFDCLQERLDTTVDSNVIRAIGSELDMVNADIRQISLEIDAANLTRVWDETLERCSHVRA